MPPNLGQAANTAFINVMALVNIVTSAEDIPSALETWEREQRSISNHVQNWSYLYGYVLGKWPDSLLSLRSGFVSTLSKTKWFDESLNRGARHVPIGYKKYAAALPIRIN
jgi:2-polyprenyl-6-methoxyphenol hydroxylase-like FAD-dependent oxidoreductase